MSEQIARIDDVVTMHKRWSTSVATELDDIRVRATKLRGALDRLSAFLTKVPEDGIGINISFVGQPGPVNIPKEYSHLFVAPLQATESSFAEELEQLASKAEELIRIETKPETTGVEPKTGE